MSLMSFYFFVFLLGTFFLYYVFPKAQKWVLLGASLLFYFAAAAARQRGFLVCLTGYVFLVTYFGARLIEKAGGKAKSAAAILCITALVLPLFVFKYAYNLGTLLFGVLRMQADISWLDFVPIMGMSYFTLSAIGYLIDILWATYPAERSAGTVALFLFYFPQVISGPVTRMGEMRERFDDRHMLQYENVAYGLRRMLWGYFKKLVISERFALVVPAVYENYQNYGGLDILLATVCYAIQLYTDFSGCMDIVLGASALFGIELPENFDGPFFSRTVQEFWQRWHITLGNWFKDYVMYPVQISKPMVKLGKTTRKHFGKKIGKKVPFYLAMTVLWLLIGIWHGGTGYYFMASAVVPFLLLTCSDLLQPAFTALRQKLHINPENPLFILFQRGRTLLLLCLCWTFVCSGSVGQNMQMIRYGVSHLFTFRFPGLLSGGENVLSLGAIALCGLLTAVTYYLHEKGSSLRKVLDDRSFAVRACILYVEIFLVLLQGEVGQSAFIYFNF